VGTTPTATPPGSPRGRGPSSSRAAVPLRAWPLRAGQDAPEILGLDRYGYTVGSRLHARAEARFLQEIRREEEEAAASAAGRLRPPLQRPPRPPSAPSGDGSRERLVEAATGGGAAILWNSSKVASTDSGASAVRKRRQKLTDDMLREIVVCGSGGDSFNTVRWWFQVFDFYCDRPEEVALPVVPATREEEEEMSDLLQCRRASREPSRCSSASAKRSATREEVLNCATPMERPRLRQQPGIPPAPKPHVNEALWRCWRKERRTAAADSSPGLDLAKRYRTESLDMEQLADWVQDYEAQKTRRKHQARLATSTSQLEIAPSGLRGNVLANALDWAIEVRDGDGGSSSNDAEDFDYSSEVSASSGEDGGCRHNGTRPSKRSAEQVMLQSANNALLDCGLLRNAGAMGEEGAKQSRTEALRTRARMLRSIQPVQMTTENLARCLFCFGVAKRSASDRIAAFLLRRVAGRTSLEQGSAPAGGDEGSPDLPFEAFYRLVRALLGGNATVAGALSSSGFPLRRAASAPAVRGAAQGRDLQGEVGDSSIAQSWKDSELLRRCCFAVLTGQPGVAAKDDPATRRMADVERLPLPLAGLLETLRMVLCVPVLLEVDREGGESSGDVASTASSGHAVAAGAVGMELRVVAEFLRAQLLQAEAAGPGGLVGCGAQLSRRPSGISTAAVENVSFSGFERLVARQPAIFAQLISLLFPLATRGGAFAAAEMALAQKKHAHHGLGELRAKLHAQTQRLQSKHLERLHRDMALPWLQARRARSRPHSGSSAGRAPSAVSEHRSVSRVPPVVKLDY